MLYANRAMIEYLGYDAENGLLGPTLAELSDELIHPGDRARTRDAFASLFANLGHEQLSGETVRIDEVRLRRRGSGQLRYCDMHGVVILHDGAPALVTYLNDHTERRIAAEYMRLADRMSALGTLAAGVAHEINNPLTYVIANVDVVLRMLAPPPAGVSPECARALTDARVGLDRIHQITRSLRTFSRSDDETITAVDLGAVLDASMDMARNHLRHRGRLVRRYEPVTVRGNAARLGQVFLNLLLNAAQALDEGRFAHNEIVVDVERSSSQAVVTVRDNGVGIAAHDLPRVFDAFFTTKPVGVGTGLGLFVCHGIVTALGGTISIESEPGHGTCVRVGIPLADAAGVTSSVEPSAVTQALRGRVIVIDDEPLVLAAVRRLLEDEHDVIVETSAEAALELLLGDHRFDVVLCDLMMPGMRGDEMFAALQARLPDMSPRVLFMSGGAVTDTVSAFAATHADAVVEKPLDATALLARVRVLVDDRLNAPRRRS
jgi:signal transduction histidine kinase/CheY-like chemotaxis protein